MRFLLALAAAAGLSGAEMVRRFDATSGVLRVEVEKTRLMRGKKHSIVFTRWRGELGYDPDRLQASWLSVTVEAAGFRVEDTWVDEKDRRKIEEFTRSPDVLDVARSPLITFEARGFLPDGPGRLRIPGRLAVRGVTRDVELSVLVQENAATGTAVFSMSGFGIRPPSAALGTVGTKDELRVAFQVRTQ